MRALAVAVVLALTCAVAAGGDGDGDAAGAGGCAPADRPPPRRRPDANGTDASYPTTCTACRLRNEVRQMSLAVIKEQVLAKLGFAHAPNTTGRVLPPVPEDMYAKVNERGRTSQPQPEYDMLGDQPPSYVQRDQADEFHARTANVIAYPQVSKVAALKMEQLRVQWTEFPASLTGALGQLQHAGELADVTLACEGQRIHAHKLVLSACSPYFRDAFKENPCHHPIIILKDVRAQDILNLLSYMYQGEVNVEEDKLTSFIQTAELLQIKGLTTTFTPQCKKQSTKSGPSAAFCPKKLTPQITASKKNSLQQNLIVKETRSSNIQQKRRRNSASERIPDSRIADFHKKTKVVKEKCSPQIKKGDIRNATEDKNDPSKKENDNGNTSNNDTAKPLNIVTEDTTSLVNIEIKHEVEEPEEQDVAVDEDNMIDDSDTGIAPVSPSSIYENSMLARSLLSGAQALKIDNASNISLNKSNKASSVTTNISVFREAVNTQTALSKITDESIVKIERTSPKLEVMELEPEILISEQDDSIPGTLRPVISSKNLNQIMLRTDQAGTSTSQTTFGQTNHAAICGDCPHCGTKYSNQSALKYHVRLMHSDLTNRLCCYLCPRSFTMRDTFKEHMWTSHGQRN